MSEYEEAFVVLRRMEQNQLKSIEMQAEQLALVKAQMERTEVRVQESIALQKVAVAGLGGLGHMGVKFAAALGAHVTMITTSPEKAADARALGAHDVIISSDGEQMAAARSRFDFILDTIPVAHDVQPYLMLLRRAGRMVIVGAIEPLPSIHGGLLISNNRAIGGSGVGGVPETQEMLDFCAKHDLYPEVETIRMDQVNEAFERLLKNDVRYRFVIDMATMG